MNGPSPVSRTQAGQSPFGALSKIFSPQLSQTVLAVFICPPNTPTTLRVHYEESGSQKRRQAAALQSPESFRGKTIRVYSCPFVVNRATRKPNDAIRPQRRRAAPRCGQFPHAITRGNAGEA